MHAVKKFEPMEGVWLVSFFHGVDLRDFDHETPPTMR
jgi:hypothetical protein